MLIQTCMHFLLLWKKDILKNGVEYERINNPFECKVLAKGKNTSRGDVSVKMPVCDFTILNPKDWIPFVNLSCSFDLSSTVSVHLTFCIIYGPCLFFPHHAVFFLLFFTPETSIQERSQARHHFYTDFWDACLACWCSQNFLYLICLCSLWQTSALNTPPALKPWGSATAVLQCMNKLLPFFLLISHFRIKWGRCKQRESDMQFVSFLCLLSKQSSWISVVKG